MKKTKHLRGTKKFLALGVAVAYMCIATACTSGTNNSGSMAGNGSSSGVEHGIADNNNSTANNTNNDSSGITGTGGARAGDNDSIWDDAGKTITNVVDDVKDGISDLTGINDSDNTNTGSTGTNNTGTSIGTNGTDDLSTGDTDANSMGTGTGVTGTGSGTGVNGGTANGAMAQ